MADWFQSHALALGFWAIVLFLLYRFADPLIHRLMTGLADTQMAQLPADDGRRNEVIKRMATLERLLAKALRAAVFAGVVLIVFSVFDLWPVLAGLGIVVAALTLAGQSIVLDYLMGVLILIEGQFYVGDVIRVGATEGTVEEIGFRRTSVRDTSGTVHSISNGEIRISSNLTRIYATSVVEIQGIQDADVEGGIAAMRQVGVELGADPDWGPRLMGPPGEPIAFAFTDLGVTLRMSLRVVPEERWRVAAEARRRVSVAFAAAGVQPNRRTV